MSLRTIIENLGLASASAGEVVTALSATVVAHIDHTRQNFEAMVNAFGLQVAEGLLSALKEAGLHGSATLYVGQGIDLSRDDAQQQLDALAAAVPALADVCAALKLAGKRTAPLWQARGLESLPSEAEIAAVQAAIADSQAVATFFNEVLNPLVASGAGKAEIKAAVAAW